MIRTLTIKNIALIDELHIEFGKGLNVLSGETGAGKSIVVDSMNLVLGERADKELIRHDREKAYVEAVLHINSAALGDIFERNELDADDELILSRDLSVTGKNVCRINGIVVSLAVLKEFTDHIIDLHGQHQHQSLLYAKSHLDFVDSFGKETITPVKQEISGLYDRLKEAKKRLSSIGGDERDRAQSVDLLAFQIKEIEDAGLKPGENDSLKEEREKLVHAQAIAQSLASGYEALYAGGDESASVLSMLQEVVARLTEISHYDEQYRALTEKLQDNVYAVEECAHDMRSLADSVSFDEQRQEEIEQRLDLIHSLKRKYGADEDEILAFCRNAEDKLYELQNAEKLAAELMQEIVQLKQRLYACYKTLSDARKQAAERLGEKLLAELRDLGMPDARFEVRFQPLKGIDDAVYTRNGIDDMEFMISTNAGEPLKPLSKTASGGEISRIMLAFKNLSAGMDHISTLIFDEIDTGISGKMALTVAEKMASIAQERQVICVSHLPQIAAMGDENYLISKHTENGVTNTDVTRLCEEQKTAEVSRLSGGLQSESSQKYAQDLIQNAARFKAALPGN
ncbi:MAG: DNA repair protein RecN [Christensenella sp.]|uniref:DNA repair protein RecN n=1 Tax=Christensenella sp. TaxID=1935934 RepID=UPI002B1FAD9C|nr:DNA repair protein RecN [Christensenella sp.]MEA5002910.1 DNA repair protein RecN [Christensenella sp.]